MMIPWRPAASALAAMPEEIGLLGHCVPHLLQELHASSASPQGLSGLRHARARRGCRKPLCLKPAAFAMAVTALISLVSYRAPSTGGCTLSGVLQKGRVRS